MVKTALILLAVALSVFAPFVGGISCAEPSCCAQMQACCGHCHCPMQTCSVAKPVTLDQQAPLRTVELSPRISVALFTLSYFHPLAMPSERQTVFAPADSPPRGPQSLRSRLCIWLI